jgi:hypothetical protein
MISIDLMGGLGNQLFQIATVIAYCIQEKTTPIFPYSETLNVGVVRPTYWNTLLKKIKKFTTLENPIFTNETLYHFSRYNEPSFNYKQIPSGLENCLFCGYFQSYKYIDNHKNTVLDITGLKDERLKISNEYSNTPFFKNVSTISVHFRRGDYKIKQEYHPILQYEYYDKAMDMLPLNYLESSNVMYFCEVEDRKEVDEIMMSLKEKYNFMEMCCVDHSLSDWKQLLLMSLFQVNIIANSSFSWWAAYINNNDDKTVICPKIWFGPAMSCNTSDICPSEWIKI